MLDGTRREVLEVLLDGEASATDVATELDLSVQTVYRHLQELQDAGYVRQSGTRSGSTRPYELYAVEETASLFSIQDGRIIERTLDLGGVQKLLFSILDVPQEEFHLPLLSYLVDPPGAMDGVEAVAVYGPVARGEATPDDDVDLLFVTADDAELPDAPATVPASFEDGEGERPDDQWLVSVESVTSRELQEGLDSDGFLQNAVAEAIVLYDPEGILREAKAE